jgi:hypothetical protein
MIDYLNVSLMIANIVILILNFIKHEELRMCSFHSFLGWFLAGMLYLNYIGWIFNAKSN